jgi:hypothetical protein
MAINARHECVQQRPCNTEGTRILQDLSVMDWVFTRITYYLLGEITAHFRETQSLSSGHELFLYLFARGSFIISEFVYIHSK